MWNDTNKAGNHRSEGEKMKALIEKMDNPQAMKVQRVELTGMGRWNVTCFS